MSNVADKVYPLPRIDDIISIGLDTEDRTNSLDQDSMYLSYVSIIYIFGGAIVIDFSQRRIP